MACRRLARVGRRCEWICAAYACSADMAVRRLLWRLSHGHRLLTRRDCSSTASTSWSTSLPRRRNAVPVILLRVSHPSRLVVSVHRSLRVLFRPRGSPIERDGASSSARSSVFSLRGPWHLPYQWPLPRVCAYRATFVSVHVSVLPRTLVSRVPGQHRPTHWNRNRTETGLPIWCRARAGRARAEVAYCYCS